MVWLGKMAKKNPNNPHFYITPLMAFAFVFVTLMVRAFFIKTGKPYALVEYTTYFDIIILLTSLLIDIVIQRNKKWWSYIRRNSGWLKISICLVILTFWYIVRKLFIPALGNQIPIPKTYFILLCLPLAIYGIIDFIKRQYARRASKQ